MKRICLFFTVLAACWNLQGQYLENFTGQNGKGLVDAICPPTATGISDCGCACTANPSPTDDISTCTVVPPDLSGVTWSITGSDFTGFDHSSPDDFGVEFLSGNEVFQANDNDNELCWVSPTLNISAAGAVSISIDAGEVDDLEADDYIKAEYSLDGGPFVQFGLAADDFTSTTFSVSGLTGNTLTIRVCIDDNGSSEIIWFDNVSVPQSGVFINCNQPTLSAKILDAACGPNSGSIDLTAAGGSPPYSYAWSNGPATQDITGLAPGTYTVTVTDGADCPVVQSYTVGDSPIAQHAAAYAAYCDEANGSVNLTVSGGNAPYTYAWTGGAATEDLTGVAAGDYTVTITDDGGCTSVQTYTVGSQSLSDGPYLEDFSTPGKGYLTNFQDDFFGVNWTLSPWPQGAPGRDASDYFETTAGGVLHAQDVDFEVCWNSPLLNISASGTVQFSVDLTWQTLEPDDYIAVQYSLDGGPFAEVSNIAGGGGRTVQYTSGINSGAGTAAASGLSGGTLQIRICFLAESNSDIITIDNVSVPQAVSLCQGPPDLCPDDPDKTEPGVCGCGVPDTDADNDGTADCNDLCPNDPNKVAPGDCGCGTADNDADNDGTADCNDLCPNDPNKIAPGDCGCGTADTDADNDGTADCNDLCPNDPNKIAPGDCGCGTADTDADNDGTPDCNDLCPNDPNKIAPGDCGCGTADNDADNDGTADCNDLCPNDPNKIAPGDCGCGTPDTDADNDGTADCNDLCPNDPNKIAPGTCGCGTADTDADNDGTANCNDLCPNDPNKIAPGTCGCGTADTDADNDGIADCADGCPDVFSLSINLSFSHNGAGEFCWVTDGNINFINSWNLALLEVNGVPYTNQWATNMPPRIDGKYFFHYKSNYPWGHFEVNGINPSPNNGCGNPVAISIPFSKDGVGEFCWETTDDISYINSWNLDLLEINGVDLTNQWSASLPPKVNGKYAIVYATQLPWGHFEAGGGSGSRPLGGFGVNPTTDGIDLGLFPNPANAMVNITMNGIAGRAQLTIYDQLGRSIWTRQVEQGQQALKVDLRNGIFKNGIYFVTLTSQGESKTVRLMISNL